MEERLQYSKYPFLLAYKFEHTYFNGSRKRNRDRLVMVHGQLFVFMTAQERG